MILFKQYHVPLILSGRKTQTRRLGKKRWTVGKVYQAKTSYMAKPFAYLKLTDLRYEPLEPMSEADAHAEGYNKLQSYLQAFKEIYKYPLDEANPLVWVLDFELASVPGHLYLATAKAKSVANVIARSF